ncbi:Uncharacterised protein [Mycobacteroides abscessus subsp. abscessus]|nr:Uncharacterised protein [Mycobacteroides abscessus subsp. abscessus]
MFLLKKKRYPPKRQRLLKAKGLPSHFQTGSIFFRITQPMPRLN